MVVTGMDIVEGTENLKDYGNNVSTVKLDTDYNRMEE